MDDELIEKMAREAAFTRRSKYDQARDADHYWEHTSKDQQEGEIRAMTAALAAMREAMVPVAWRYSHPTEGSFATTRHGLYQEGNGWTETPLYSLPGERG